MAITWINIEEGDGITADSLNNRFQSIESEINDLQPEDIQLNSLEHQHLPSMVLESKSAVIAAAGSTHAYDAATNPYPGFDVDLYDVSAGWTSLKYGATPLDLTFDTSHDLSEDGVRGILVMANINIKTAESTAGGTTVLFPIVVVQAILQSGLQTTIQKSERFTASEVNTYVYSPYGATAAGVGLQRPLWKDIPIRTFITSSEVSEAVTGIRVLIGISNQDTLAGTHTVKVGRASLQAIVFKAGGENFG